MRTLAALAAAAVLAGCGSNAPKQALPPAPSLPSTCGTVAAALHATTHWLTTSDGVRLYAASAGKGATAVVLAHESPPADVCGWLGTMAWLTAHGIAAVALDFRGTSPSGSPPLPRYFRYGPDLQAGVDAARAAGASRVVVMGASLGGAAALANAPALRGVDAFVSLSGEQRVPGFRLDATAALPRMRAPLLVVASRKDHYLDAAAARRLLALAGSPRKRLALFPGAYHGWDVLDIAPYRARARAIVLAWIRG